MDFRVLLIPLGMSLEAFILNVILLLYLDGLNVIKLMPCMLQHLSAKSNLV